MFSFDEAVLTPQVYTRSEIIAFAIKALRQVERRPLSIPEVVGKGLRLITLWASKGGGKTTLLERIAQDFKSKEGADVSGPWNVAEFEQDWRNLLLAIQREVETLTAGNRKALLLDNLDRLLSIDDGKAFFEFEKELIHPLVEREDILIIVASQVELKKLERYELRKRRISLQVPTMTRAELAEDAAFCGMTSSEMYEISLGYPQAVNWLRQDPQMSKSELACQANDYLVESLSQPVRDVARVASLLPTFSVPILRLLLFPSETGNQGGYGDFIEWLRELAGTSLITWDVNIGAYRFCDGNLRRLLARCLSHRDPDEYLRVRKQAVEYFDEEVQYAMYLQNSLPSAVYHRARLLHSEGVVQVGEICRDWVEHQILAWTGADWDLVAKAWLTGANDPMLAGELQDLLGDSFAQIEELLVKEKEKSKGVNEDER